MLLKEKKIKSIIERNKR